MNDWFDRHVDAINEPNRPIPSGRIPGRWGLYIAIIWTVLSLAVALALGPVVFWAAVFGMAMAWAYSAPPFRFKANGWWGNAAVGLCYEGLPWFTGAAVLLGAVPRWPVIVLALLYSLGAHGIMTLNDFKAIEGDTRMGVRSLPVQLGVEGAARTACAVMALPQVDGHRPAVLLGQALPCAGASLVLLAVQLVMMRRFLADPVEQGAVVHGLRRAALCIRHAGQRLRARGGG